MSHAMSRRHLLQLGACVGAGLACPALGQPIHTPEGALDRWHRGICGQCGLLDPVSTGVQDGIVSTLKGDPLSPTSLGRLCTRGMTLPAALVPDRRVTMPLLRKDSSTKGSDGGLSPISWEEAYAWLDEHLGSRLRGTPERIATLLDADLPCETQYTASRLLQGFFGCAHVDSSLRLDGAAGLRASTDATGLPAPTGSVADVDGADLFLIVGADPAERHSTLFYRMVQCQRRGGHRTVVLDPRRTLTCGLADVFVRPRVPGTDAAVLRAMTHVLLSEGIDRATGLEGHDAMVAAARSMEPRRAAELSGAKVEDIEAAARAIGESAGTFTAYGRGLMRSGARAVRALYDLLAVAGKLQGGSSTVLPLLEGANAAGAWLMGAPAGGLPAMRRLDSADDRRAMASLWACAEDRIPEQVGLRLGEWLPALESGRLDAMLWLGGNPLPRLPANVRWRSALERSVLVHATPVHPVETSAWADLVLPVALPWLEERGSFIACDRRVQLTAPAGPPEGIPTSLGLIADLAVRWLQDDAERAPFAEISEMGPELAWDHCRAASEGRPCDLTGLTYEILDREPGVLWPFPTDTELGDPTEPASAHVQAPRLSLSSDAGAPSAEGDTGGDLWLIPTATSHHTFARELTGFVPELHYASPRAWIEISGRDASKRKIRDGSWVAAESKHGVLVARAWITDRVVRGVIAVPEHFGFVSDLEGGTDGRGEAESLVASVLPLSADPDSGQLGVTPVRVSLREPTEAELAARALRRI